jgi:ankyrin repeat protein
MRFWENLFSASKNSPKTKDIRELIRLGDLKSLRSRLKKQPALATDWKRYEVSPMHVAAETGRKEVIELLLAHGARVDEVGTCTPLFAAAANGHKNVVELLLSRGAEVNTGRRSEKPLHVASSRGDKDVVEVLLAHGAEINAEDSIDWTPLHYAVQDGNEAVIQLLLARGANINANGHGTPLHTAVKYHRRGVAAILIAHGADVSARDSEGKTPLHTAAEYGANEEVKLLLAHGADINATDDSGETSLHKAAGSREMHSHRFPDLVEDQLEVLKTLLSNGADLNAATCDGRLAWNMVYREPKKLDLLLAKGADVNSADGDGNTQLHHHTHESPPHKTVSYLIGKGADVNAKNKKGMTLLHIAAGEREDYTGLVELLVAGKADVNVVDNDGITPLDYAIGRGHLKIRDLLVANGARAGGARSQGELQESAQALIGAVRNLDVERVRRLLKAGALTERAAVREAEADLRRCMARRDALRREREIPSRHDRNYQDVVMFCTGGERAVLAEGDNAEEILTCLNESLPVESTASGQAGLHATQENLSGLRPFSVRGRLAIWGPHSYDFSSLSEAEARWVLNGRLLFIRSKPTRDEVQALMNRNVGVVSLLHAEEGNEKGMEWDLEIVGTKVALSLAVRSGMSYENAYKALMGTVRGQAGS